MESISYSANFDASRDKHWFFAGREHLIRGWLATFGIAAPMEILDFGAGTGSLTPLLSEFGTVTSIEPAEEARRLAATKGIKLLSPDDLKTGARFDLIVLLDVLEHVKDDEALLSAMSGKLKPGGKIIVTVPAHQLLWNYNDLMSRHVRRYSTRGLNELIDKTGLKAVWFTHYNFLLLPAAILVALKDFYRSRQPFDPEDPFAKNNGYLKLPPRPINRFLTETMKMESLFFKHRRSFPVGISICAVLEK